MKLLLIIDSIARGGRERRMIELLKGIKKEPDFQAEIVVFSRRVEYPEILTMGFPIHYLERIPKKDPRVFFRFYKLCKSIRPDIIHSWGIMSSILALPAVGLLGIKLISGNIYDAPEHLNWLNTNYFRAQLSYPFADRVLSNSLAGLKSYGAPVSKSQCIYNGIDLNRIVDLKDPEKIKADFGLKDFVVGMVGAFQDRKDYDTFIKGALLVVKKHKDVSFIAIGGGKNLEQCKALVPPPYQENIVFAGQQNQVESIINTFDVGVLMTNAKIHGEGISNSIMEYMLLQKPVIASDGGGTPEIVVHGETGFLVPPFSAEGLADKVEFFLERPEERERMGLNGEQRIRNNFALDTMVENYFNLYREVMHQS